MTNKEAILKFIEEYGHRLTQLYSDGEEATERDAGISDAFDLLEEMEDEL